MGTIIFLVGFIIGFFIGRMFQTLRYKRELEADLQEALEEAKESKKVTRIDAYLTKCEDMYYLYNKEDDHFLAQGKDIEEVTKKIMDRFPNMNVFVDKTQAKDLGLIE